MTIGRWKRTGEKRVSPVTGKFRSILDIWIAYFSGLRHLFHNPYTLNFPVQRYAVEK